MSTEKYKRSRRWRFSNYKCRISFFRIRIYQRVNL